jgi:uncharacterized repeat protein (TIGR03803 family)
MTGKRFSIGLRTILLILVATLFATSAWAATRERVLYAFNNTDGYQPLGSLIFDASGNLYGTTYEGGANGAGTVFELEPKAGGGWTESVLYSFCTLSSCTDGANPYFVPLIFDVTGNLYGTTLSGGTYGDGTVFELTPAAGGGWTETVLHSFANNSTDGYQPASGLIFDTSGNLYGTTGHGGDVCDCGTVFELTPAAGGSWTETVLHSFGHGTDGINLYAGLIFDTSGNLYGPTQNGGAYRSGTVFELTPAAGGSWTETVLYSFGGTNGANPYGPLTFDAAGNLYGTTEYGGAYSSGTVFRLKPKVSGGWTEKVLHNFQNNGTDGYLPDAGLIFDASGNLYGTTPLGGDTCSNCGTVFELEPKAGGGWTEKVLHNFSDNGKDGINPQNGLIFDAAGNLYGTTNFGGLHGNYGTVFEITP